jgi:D-alanyl-D-alanine carboxypeptidase
MPIASVTKVMTALVVLENTKLTDVVTVMKDACGIEGSSVYLYEGEKLSVSDLLYAMMLESANDAAACLAIYTAKSINAFSDLMNEKAEEIGLVNTHFNNPHGLEDPEHYSTANDVALLWQEAMKNDDFRCIVGTKTHRIDLSEEDGYRFLSNHNKLLKSYENSIGGKTGFTKTAGRCLVSGAGKDGLELVMVTLNDPNDWQDHKNLFDYTFSLYSKVNVATVGSLSFDIDVVGGKEKSLSLSNIEPLTLSVRDVSKITSRVEAPRFIFAPVLSKDKPLAKVVYLYDGKELASVDLYPKTTVETVKKESFIKRLLNFFK